MFISKLYNDEGDKLQQYGYCFVHLLHQKHNFCNYLSINQQHHDKIYNSVKNILSLKISSIHAFFISNTFLSNARLKLVKNLAKDKQYPVAELLLFENYSISSSTLSFKNNRRYSKKCTKIKCVCLNEAIWLAKMKMRLKIKSTSHRFDINRPRPRNGHKDTKYKMCLSIMMVICIEQHLRNIWSSIHEKVRQHWGSVEKSITHKKAITRSFTWKQSSENIKILNNQWSLMQNLVLINICLNF